MKKAEIEKRLEYLRGELRAERISYGEIHELQSLAKHINPGDVELLEAAGVPEFHYTGIDADESEHTAALCSCKLIRLHGTVRLYHCPMHDAAPELLAALQHTLCYLEADSDDAQERADHAEASAAIAKAAL
jgi:hypothetical protein